MRSPTLIERVHSGRLRVLIAAAVATVVAAVAGWFAPWQLTVLIWWDVAALSIVTSVWGSVVRFSAQETAAFATQEDDSRAGTQLMLLGAAVVSLVGVVLAFIKGNSGDRALEALLEGMGVFTIACSWALVHTVFALRYAHLYYTEPRGGIDFKMKAEPDYRDFAYTAFTVGMTFQVSDTDITQQRMRRAVLRHALLSFLFGSVILAATVNVVAGLLNN
jgi:uncharacterized membrane protein